MSMDSKVYNLDEGIQEYFEFIIKGNKYKFRHLNTEEMEKFRVISEDEEKAKTFLYDFISKESDEAPDFSEVAKKMITPQWVKFRKMLLAEMSDEN